MLHVTKVLCLVLAAAVSAHGYLTNGNYYSTGTNDLDNLVSSNARGRPLFQLWQSFNTTIVDGEKTIMSEYASLVAKMGSVMEMIENRLEQLEQRGDDDHYWELESRWAYDTEEEIHDRLSEILNEAGEHLESSTKSVEHAVVMHEKNRITEDQVVELIKNNELRSKETVRLAMSEYNKVRDDLDEIISKLDDHQ